MQRISVSMIKLNPTENTYSQILTYTHKYTYTYKYTHTAKR
jgi:hypothetical protein